MTRKILPLAAGLALLAGAAHAGPFTLSDAQMDGVTAGTIPGSGILFNSANNFATHVNSPYTLTNSAAAGAVGEAVNPYQAIPILGATYSFTKGDTSAVAVFLGGSQSVSTSAAVINSALICHVGCAP